MISSSDFAGFWFFRTVLIFALVDPIFPIRRNGRLPNFPDVYWVSSPYFIVRSAV